MTRQIYSVSVAKVPVEISDIPTDLNLIKSLHLQYTCIIVEVEGWQLRRLTIYINKLIIFGLSRLTLIIDDGEQWVYADDV